jgi:hypothetical protein
VRKAQGWTAWTDCSSWVRGPILFRYKAGSVPVPQTDFIGKNSKEIALIDDVDTRVPSRSQFARRFSPATTIPMHQALGFVQALNLNHLSRRIA